MSGFFNRLQRASRFYDSSAPAYLRTHPLTSERISDMEARSESAPYHQIPDSLDFQLVRARLRSREGNAEDALAAARAALKDGRYSSETAARYGLGLALLRARQFDEAEAVAQKLVSAGKGNALLASLPGHVAFAAGKPGLAVQRYQAAVQTHPGYRPLQYGLIAALLAANQPADSLHQTSKALDLYPGDRRLWQLAARAHAQLGHKLLSHRAQAEAAALAGNLIAAIEQIDLGIRAADGSFYDLSSAEARRREWKALEKAQRKS
jgi:predicted Zn-dependent protease